MTDDSIKATEKSIEEAADSLRKDYFDGRFSITVTKDSKRFKKDILLAELKKSTFGKTNTAIIRLAVGGKKKFFGGGRGVKNNRIT